MSKKLKIYIAGHRGMVGSALAVFESKGFTNIIGKSSKELDLRDQSQVESFIRERADVIIDAAAKVGGFWPTTPIPMSF